MTSVAIVMRTYERPVMLARALESVCSQTLADRTLVVVNNGGAPGPVDNVVRLACLGHPGADISVLHLDERVGMEEASNRGLSATKSEFFAIHDDDDTWKPEFLAVTVAALRERPDASAVVTGVIRVHETFTKGRVWPVRNEMFHLTADRLTAEGMIGNNTFPPVAALFRRSLLDRVGGFDSSLPVLGDWEFNLRALTVGPFVFLPRRLANYHTRTPESDVAAGNSITVGQDLHRRIKAELQQRWDAEPWPGGVSKGEASRRASQRLDEEEARVRSEASAVAAGSRAGRIVSAARDPRRAVRGTVRRVRAKVGR